MGLDVYRKKRDFQKTPEPKPGRTRSKARRPIFVIQEHYARRHHFDFRLETDGVLKSWAIPKEPLLDPYVKRLAVETEDHPLEYAKFEGTIPAGEYGGGNVTIWDHGTYENLLEKKRIPKTLSEAIDEGHVEVKLHGEKLKGKFALIRTNRGDERKPSWVFVKMWDEYCKSSRGSEAA